MRDPIAVPEAELLPTYERTANKITSRGKRNPVAPTASSPAAADSERVASSNPHATGPSIDATKPNPSAAS